MREMRIDECIDKDPNCLYHTKQITIESLSCPICGDGYQHICPEFSTSQYSVVVPFSGECGCRWALCFEFSKGNTFPIIKILKECNKENMDLDFDKDEFISKLEEDEKKELKIENK